MFGFRRAIAGALAFFCLLGSKGLKNKQQEDKTPERFIYQHVIIIGIDGAGNFHQNCDTPNMDKFIEKGAWTDHCRAATPSISAQCWGSMLTGVKPYLHKLTNDVVTSKEHRYNNKDYPTFFKLVRDAHPDAELGSFCNWYPINDGIVEQSIGVTFGTDYDAALTEKICNYIEEKKPELLFIQFDSVDHAGHSEVYGSPEYLETVEEVDGFVGQIFDSVDNAGIKNDTLLIITADHGGIGTSHGGKSEEEMNTFFGAIGKSINKTELIDVQGRDLASVVCYALGVDGNENWDSYIPQNMFRDNMNPPERPIDTIAEHTNEETPAADSEGAIANYIDMEHLRTGLFFDNGLEDLVDKEKAETVGTVYYPDGYYGSALRVSSEGYLSFPEMTFGLDSFTISFWVKVDDGVDGDPALFSNKDWTDGHGNGFVYVYNNGTSKFNAGDGRRRDDIDYCEPSDFSRWNHVIIVADREDFDEIKVYSNFELISDNFLKRSFATAEFDAGLPLNFGQDGTGAYKDSISAEFDDILIFDKALTEEEVANLKNYYVK